MSMTRDDYKKALTAIRDEALEEKNPYALNADAQRYLRIALNTLLQLLDRLDTTDLLNGKALYELPSSAEMTAPIHLENHPVGTKREASFNETLFGPFVTYFDHLKNHDEKIKHIQKFCSILNGYCIEARTRDAFTYAQSIMFGMDLTEIDKAEQKAERAQPTLLQQLTLDMDSLLDNPTPNNTGVSVYHPHLDINGTVYQPQPPNGNRNTSVSLKQPNKHSLQQLTTELDDLLHNPPANSILRTEEPPSPVATSQPNNVPLLGKNQNIFYRSTSHTTLINASVLPSDHGYEDENNASNDGCCTKWCRIS